MTYSTFISSFKKIIKPGTYKCTNKRCKISQNYLNKTNKLMASNTQIWEICWETDWGGGECLLNVHHLLAVQASIF